MTAVKCVTCGNPIGIAMMDAASLLKALPMQFRGLSVLIPKDANMTRVIIDALNIQGACCANILTKEG